MAEQKELTEQEKFYNSFLSAVERAALQAIADNAVAVLALKKIILADVYYKGVLRPDIDPKATMNAALAMVVTKPDTTNEILGQDLRAMSEGARLVEMGIGRLESFKTPEKAPAPTGNRGR